MKSIWPHLLNWSVVLGLISLLAGAGLLIDGVRKSIQDANEKEVTDKAVEANRVAAQEAKQEAEKLDAKKQDVPPPVKERFFSLLRRINPAIPHQGTFTVLIDQSNSVVLSQMALEPNFSDFATITPTGNSSIASSNVSFGQDYTDVTNTGNQQTYRISIKP